MAGSPAVLLLDDGELDDIQRMLEEMRVPYGRVRGGAIVRGTPPPADLLISTPRRIDAVRATASISHDPLRIVVVDEDSTTLRDQLRRVGFDYLVRRPVHPEALRLLLLHSLYKGDERRREPRVAVGVEVSFRTGLLTRRATLADLSIRGCRLLTRAPLDAGKRIKIHIPEALDAGDPFTVAGKILRVDDEPGHEGMYGAAILFERVSDDTREALEFIIEDRATGPATLRPAVDAAAEPAAPEPEPPKPPPARRKPRGVVEKPLLHDARRADTGPAEETDRSASEAGHDLANETGTEAAAEAAPAPSQPERRTNRRGAYPQTVPAFGNRALRVLVGRDLSVGGMRIERLPGLEVGDRLHLAIYGTPGDPPFLVWGTVSRDDGERGMAVVFDALEQTLGERLERLVGALPAVEDLHDTELDAMGKVMSEILED
jgi:hypothetical protein